MNESNHTVVCDDGYPLTCRAYESDRPGGVCMVIAPALGVPQRFYRDLARFLADAGITIVSLDYRGVGDSSPQSAKAQQLTFADWGRFDIDAALSFARQRFTPDTMLLLGHSCGGQLFGLAPQSETLDGVVFVASGLAHWRLWAQPARTAMFLVWGTVVPLLSLGRKNFPARRLGFSSVDLPSGVTRQWAKWAMHPDYLFAPRFGLDTSRYAAISVPALAWSFSDDRYAPREAVDALLDHFPALRTERRHVAAAQMREGRIGHFGFFKPVMRDQLWPDLLGWINSRGTESRGFARR